MTIPRLHAITDDARLAHADFVDDAAALVEAGGDDVALHLRGRATSAARMFELAVALLPVARAAGAKLLVNDRVDVALVAGADGAHLREDSLDAHDARRILGDAALIGVSRHGTTIEPASIAGADFVVWGSVFETASHPGAKPAGLDALRSAIQRIRANAGKSGRPPVIAIGGVTPDRVGAVLEAGADGVAALSGIWDRGARAVEGYRAALRTARPETRARA
ncbi:MAG TPA: thiamine phosphate synthase [Longimicrobiales bacterium]|nr:thiamine phosphate synthase [Longimicrobiales bacterium]